MRLAELLKKHSENKLTPEESKELDNWYYSLNFHDLYFHKQVKQNTSKEEFIQRMHEKFQQQYIHSYSKKSNNLSKKQLIAASILIFCAVSFFFYRNHLSNNIAGKLAIKKTIIEPSKEKASLKLADGRIIYLDEKFKGQLASDNGMEIMKTASGQIIYRNTKVINPSNGFNTISTPRGGQYQIILADGSHVWLNAASSLKYPVKFYGKQRVVELTGEAYFEISHDKNAPFIVRSKQQSVEVLGTHFNINSYENESFVKTTLLEGSVRIHSLKSNVACLLVPGKQAILNSNKFLIEEADLKEAIAWKNGYFMFKDEDIHLIMNKISRWYGVDIIFSTDFKNKRFTGNILRSKSINELLDIMEETNSIHFKI